MKMFCIHCGKEANAEGEFCQWCGKPLPSDSETNAVSFEETQDIEPTPKMDLGKCILCNFPLKETDVNGVCEMCRINNKVLKKSSTNKIGCLISSVIILLVVVSALSFLNSSNTSGSSSAQASNSENTSTEPADYELLVDSLAPQAVKTVLFNSGIYDIKHLFGYYPFLYKVEDDVHYGASKAFYNGIDHSYTVGIKFDDKNDPKVVFMILDDSVIIDERNLYDVALLEAAQKAVLAASANPSSVTFGTNPVTVNKENSYDVVIQRFNRLDSSGAYVEAEYYATFLYNVSTKMYDPIALQIGSNVLYDSRVSSVSPAQTSQRGLTAAELTPEERAKFNIPDDADMIEIRGDIVSFRQIEPLE